jgi:putative ATP-dependent endonuclease of OLD family
LNKRGSGVRRLVLLSFFHAKAEKKRTTAAGTPSRCVIYAVEEPETSQHPDSQEQIIRAFRDLADAGDQVLLTTHVPALAGLVPLSSLQYVDRDPATREVRVRQGTPTVYEEIAVGLGVLPDPVRGSGPRVAVLVEGKNDIDALRSMAAVLTAAGEVVNYDDSRIFWTIGGGDALKDWVERRYLDRLNIPQVIIRDSDRSAAALPLDQAMVQWLQNTNARPNVTAFITNKRNMDNYVHADVNVRLTNGQIVTPANLDWDYHRMAETLSQCLTTAMQGGLNFRPDDHDGAHITGSNKLSCRKIISAYFMRHMTADEFRQRATYTTAAGTPTHEIHEWFGAITAHLA